MERYALNLMMYNIKENGKELYIIAVKFYSCVLFLIYVDRPGPELPGAGHFMSMTKITNIKYILDNTHPISNIRTHLAI